MSGVAAEGATGGGSGQAQALKDAGTGFNFLRPGFARPPPSKVAWPHAYYHARYYFPHEGATSGEKCSPQP